MNATIFFSALVGAIAILPFGRGHAADPGQAIRPVSTYSIVARDATTGKMGVAVQSHWFSVGPVVPWAKAGVGAVATQSLVKISYGPEGLALMAGGKTAAEALAALVAEDEHPEVRQVAMVDTRGNVAAHTGNMCIPEAGHRTGDGYSVQANLMEKNTVWDAMARAYEATSGDLADRMLAALDAAQSEGGDIRGRQSAAILIVKGESSGKPWADTVMELRVEDHPEPVRELRRLVRLHRAYDHMNRGDLALERGDVDGALEEYGAAAGLAPGNAEVQFWSAVSLVNAGRLEAALPIFRKVFEQGEDWRVLLKRLPGVGLLKVDGEAMERILEVEK